MDTKKLKSFAPEARCWLLDQVELRLRDVLADSSLARRQSPRAVAQLEQQIADTSREQVVDRVAYTWFNRFCALRYMDIHGYNRVRAVSGAAGFVQPEILMEAKQGIIDDGWKVDKQRILGLLDNSVPSDDPQGEAYKLLLVGVCNSLHDAMPFLFEKIGDETELLLPANLLHTDSLIGQLVQQVDESLWQDIEIIGWLYQFYISEKKDQVIGKVVKSEDIPAATQLFTPNWIVKYMVQNSLGAQWLATYPNSPLKAQMQYYIEPAEQTDEVNAQLAAITPSELNPEELTLIDPACGSGHILVEAYELFKAIYLERGYRQRDVPQLILEKNLFGLDIDERAAQLTGFALMMKGRADDRRLFERGVKLNVMALVNSTGFDAEALAPLLRHSQSFPRHSREGGNPDYGLKPGDLTELKRLFEHATTFGSLIQVPEGVALSLPALKQLSEATSQDLFVSEALKRLGPLVRQAELLAAQYDAVVANPPYIGSKGMNALVKEFVEKKFPDAKSDLFACFIESDLLLSKPRGRLGFMSPQVWMFLSSYEKLRTSLIDQHTITSLVQPEYNAFWDSAHVTICSYIIQKTHLEAYKGTFIRLTDFYGAELQPTKTLEAIANPDCGWIYQVKPGNFKNIPGSPVAFWISNTQPFNGPRIGDEFESGGRTKTHGNETYLRYWWEIDNQTRTWVPYANGGGYRKYAGNALQVVNWSTAATSFYESHGGLYPKKYWGVEGITWGLITSARSSFRLKPSVSHYSSGAPTIFDASQSCNQVVLGFLNSPIAYCYLNAMNPTLNTTVNDVLGLPLPRQTEFQDADSNVGSCISSTTQDWDAYERSWDFQSLPILTASSGPTPTLESSYTAWITQNRDTIAEMKRLEEENNRLFIDAYGLADELTPDVPIEQITLTVNPAYRYGGKLTEEELWTRFRQDTMQELASYAIGCMLGRYSLDAPGLILANTGESVEDYERIVKEKRVASGQMQEGESFEFSFAPDDDNVIPILDGDWFTDDIGERFKTFLKAAYGTDNFEQNLRYLEDGLYPTNATAKKRKTIRDYFLKDFYGNHIKTYKKRPIYWLFSSPKGTFNALIYLHRYRPDTVSVILNDYLREYQTKLKATMIHEQSIADSANASAADQTKALKRINLLKKDLKELEDYERDVLYPLATQRLEIDLDDGVVVNYNKFGKALKKITGLTGK